MKSHLFRPLWVVIAAVILFQGVRMLLVPADFGIHGKSFTYNFYRKSNIDDWKAFKVKYSGKKSCDGEKCHAKNVKQNLSADHKVVECENCHGVNASHLNDPKKFKYKIDRSRYLCIRCHGYLPYPGNFKSTIRAIDLKKHFHLDRVYAGSLRPKAWAIDSKKHFIDYECATCHNPHKVDQFADKFRLPHQPKLKKVE